jgi:hypothetical protein
MTDATLGEATIRMAAHECTAIAAKARPEDATRLADALRTIRKSFPPLGDIVRRDKAEVILRTFGMVYDRSKPAPCERAQRLIDAAAMPLDAEGERVVEARWRSPEVRTAVEAEGFSIHIESVSVGDGRGYAKIVRGLSHAHCGTACFDASDSLRIEAKPTLS